jgi:rhodanese-related sulfurtransferase
MSTSGTYFQRAVLFIVAIMMALPAFAAEVKKVTLAEVEGLVSAKPEEGGYALIDSRPEIKYYAGHISWAQSMPFSEMEDMLDELPADKDMPIVFYCGGLKCDLSAKAASLALANGYTNVGVFAEGMPGWKQGGHTPWAEANFLKMIINDPERIGVIVDARPPVKYMGGTIPGAVNIPFKFFEAMKGLLPADLSTQLIFFCGGYKCDLSHKSAKAAKELGYRNVLVYAEGWPGWKKKSSRAFMMMNPKKPGAALAAEDLPSIEGEVKKAEFLAFLDARPSDVLLVDVRPSEYFTEEHIPGAINIPEGELSENVDKLVGYKTVILYCGTGSRASSAYYELKDLAIEGGFYNGNVNYDQNGTVSLDQ